MQTLNVIETNCPSHRVFEVARAVENWPGLLSHYRWVRFHEGNSAKGGRVEMAAVREFGKMRFPVWWMSEMEVDPGASSIRYRHVKGITRGMEVEWKFEPISTGTRVSIIHLWASPWLGHWNADKVVGPHFIEHVAGRTLRGLVRWAEAES